MRLEKAPSPDPTGGRDLLSKLLHDLAQPISALQCALEVTLQKPRTMQEYVLALQDAKEITGRMRARLEYIRDAAEATFFVR